MESEDIIQKLLREMLEPIIDDCVSRAFNKNINEFKFDRPVNNDVFGVEETAVYLKISKATVYKLSMDRQVPHYKLGKRLYFRKEEIDDWINKGKVKTQEEINEEVSSLILRKRHR